MQAAAIREDVRITTYNEQCYHQRCDEFDPAWDMAAAQQEGASV